MSVGSPDRVYYEQLTPSEYSRHTPSPGTAEAIIDEQAYAYETLQASIGIETSSLPLEDINHYFQKLGLTPPPLVVFNANPESLALIGEFDPLGEDAFKASHITGYYANSINIALVAENRQKTQDRRVSRIVHEQVHGTSLNVYRITRSTPSSFDYSHSRGGYEVESSDDRRTPYNNVFEEGRPEMLAGQFVDLQYPSIRDAAPVKIKGLWVPASYISSDRTTYSLAAPAAITLEMLIMKDPGFLDTIVEGPLTVYGLRKTVQELHKLQPGLYAELRTVPNDNDRLTDAAKVIIDRLFDGDENVPLVAHTRVRQLMQDRYGVVYN